MRGAAATRSLVIGVGLLLSVVAVSLFGAEPIPPTVVVNTNLAEQHHVDLWRVEFVTNPDGDRTEAWELSAWTIEADREWLRWHERESTCEDGAAPANGGLVYRDGMWRYVDTDGLRYDPDTGHWHSWHFEIVAPEIVTQYSTCDENAGEYLGTDRVPETYAQRWLEFEDEVPLTQ